MERRLAMIGVTERARDVLVQAKQTESITQPEVGLRLALDVEGKWGLFPDRARDDDQVVEHQGSTILLIDTDVSQALAGSKVDCRDTADGRVELVVAPQEERGEPRGSSRDGNRKRKKN